MLPVVLAVDHEALQAGRSPSQRAFDTMEKATSRLYPGHVFVMTGQGAGSKADAVSDLVSKLYRPTDIGVGGLHVGVFMFRDVFARIDVPIGFGRFAINPLEQTDLNEVQKEWVRRRPRDFAMLCDQVVDLFDFGFGLGEMGHRRKIPADAKTMMGLASFQLQAAASTLLTAFDRRGAVQAALLAVELALKGGLIANGLTTGDLRDQKKYGHHHDKLTAELARMEPSFDGQRVGAAVAAFPKYVPNRYSPTQPSRVDSGHIVMKAQYVCAEVMRLLSERNLRQTGGNSMARQYPPLP